MLYETTTESSRSCWRPHNLLLAAPLLAHSPLSLTDFQAKESLLVVFSGMLWRAREWYERETEYLKGGTRGNTAAANTI